MRTKMAAAMIFLLAVTPLMAATADNETATANDATLEITRPAHGIYLFDLRLLPLVGRVVIGPVTVEAEGSPDIDRVVFLVPPKVGCRPWEVGNDSREPFSFVWRGSNGAIQDTGIATLIARGYNGTEQVAEDTIGLLRFVA